jgi:hypothetical protein
MTWAVMINGEIILHWFPFKTNVDQHVYLGMLETVLWPRVRSVSTRHQYWYQQDGAPSLETESFPGIQRDHGQ